MTVTRVHRLTEMECCQKDEDEMVWSSVFGVVTSNNEHVRETRFSGDKRQGKYVEIMHEDDKVCAYMFIFNYFVFF